MHVWSPYRKNIRTLPLPLQRSLSHFKPIQARGKAGAA